MSLVIILVGDCIVNKECLDDENLLNLLTKSTLCIGNFESIIHNFDQYPEKYDGQGVPMHSPPSIIELLKRYNFKMLGHANNHSNDYGIGGLLLSKKYLEDSDIKVAGIGENEEAAFLHASTTVDKVRFGLISSTTTFSSWGIATPHNNLVKGKPGLNYISLSPNSLFYISKGLRILASKLENKLLTKALFFGDYKISKEEYKKIEKQIINARSNSDILVYSMHSHQGIPNKPTKALRRIAKFCIDKGVDIFFSHGSHEIRGMEIYKGKPIFYGLGNFFAQSQNVQAYPSDFLLSKGINPDDPINLIQEELSKVIVKKPGWWLSIAAKITFDVNLKLRAISIYPIDLSKNELLGWPCIATGSNKDVVMNKIQKLSRSFKTKIDIKFNHGNVII